MSETANEPPQDEGNSFNSPRNLAMEATYINHNFSQQCLRLVRTRPQGSRWGAPGDTARGIPGWDSEELICIRLSRVLQGSERYKFPNSNPFVEEDMDQSEVASVAYR